MQTRSTTADGLTVVTLEGELNKLTSDVARSELDRVLGAERLLVDLSAVTFLDSAGLHVLFRVAQAVTKAGGRLGVVVPPESPLRRVVEITHVAGAALVCDSLEAGASALHGVSATEGSGTGVAARPRPARR